MVAETPLPIKFEVGPPMRRMSKKWNDYWPRLVTVVETFFYSSNNE